MDILTPEGRAAMAQAIAIFRSQGMTRARVAERMNLPAYEVALFWNEANNHKEPSCRLIHSSPR